MKIVLAPFPTDVVGPGVVIASEECNWIVPEGETALDANALDGRGRRLKWNGNAESGDAHGIGSRAAVRNFAGIAESEIVDEARRENVSFVREEILRGDRKCAVGVRDKLQRIKNGRLGETIE